MDFVDSKYISLLSSRLNLFSRKNANTYNFRCPLCGDSQKNRKKARGYLYVVKNNTNYKCHNCGASMSFNNLLKQLDAVLHKQYVMEKFKEGHAGKNYPTPKPDLKFTKPVFNKKEKVDLPKASTNPYAKKYLEERQLDPDKFYYAEKFKKWANTKAKAFDNTQYDEPRIIIPMYDVDKNLIGFQGRAIRKNDVKYITIMIDKDHPKVYGLDTIDTSKTVYVVEGPFDSNFVKNCIAMCGADVSLDELEIQDLVYVYDNEPRNREICNRISKVIDRGDKLVIFPQTVQEKDINDMHLAGHNVMSLLESNTYQALEAKIKFNEWKKLKL